MLTISSVLGTVAKAFQVSLDDMKSFNFYQAVKYAEKLSLTIQKLNTRLTRVNFEELRGLLSEIKQCVEELEERLNSEPKPRASISLKAFN